MAVEMSDIEVRILGFIQEHEERYGETACYLDPLFSGASPDEMLSDEGELSDAIARLENGGYIKSITVDTHHAEDTKFGCFKLTRKGKSFLRK